MSDFITNMGSFFTNIASFFENVFEVISNVSVTAFDFLFAIIYELPHMIILNIFPNLPSVFSTSLTLTLTIMVVILIVKFIMLFKFW